ncbi:MAG: D-2-hydroxyacid dehydrogenase [Alphaproteobacteria bacterium]|nr:D-2-hydroxyacid dehydrogenase [Alphaproteobacteria bacterium]
MRLHIQNLPSENPVFHVTDQIWRDACARHPALAARLDATIGWTPEDFERAISQAELLVTWTMAAKTLFPAKAPKLRLIFITSAGLDRLAPYDWLPPGCALLNNSGVHGPKAGEWGLMAILMLANRMPFHATRQREKRWDKVYGSSVAGQVLLCVGVGGMATHTIDHARAFGMHVIGVRHSPTPHEGCHRIVTTADLDSVLPEADYVLLTCPLTPATRGLVSRARLALMKPTAGLINMARGAVVDQDALCDALDAGTLGGAVLDVFVPEPLPPESRVWTTRNLLIAPHVSADDPLTYTPRSLDVFFRNLAHHLAGGPLPNAIDLARGY